MIGWVIGAVCVVAWLFTARKIFYQMRIAVPPDDSFDAAMTGLLAMLAGLLWPLALPAAIVMWHPRRTPDELRNDLAARDRRIAKLERELGMRQ